MIQTPIIGPVGIRHGRALLAGASLIVLLSGCMSDGLPFPTRNAIDPTGITAPKPGAARLPGTTAQSSSVIADLETRRSVLPASGPYAQIATAVLDHSAGPAQADLRVARLTAKAKSKNWMPQIGPSISLSSLDQLVSQLVVDQVLFDNGAKKAEREFAAADVEVAAVGLSQEMNDEVYDGLKFYVSSLKAQAQSQVGTQSAAEMAEFERILRERAKGGLSDLSEVRIVAQKRAEAQAEADADRDASNAALAQLRAMTGAPLSGLSGLSQITLPVDTPEALDVKLAQSEQARANAEAKLARAGHRPSLGVKATAGSGKPSVGLNMGMTQMLGFGRSDTLAALDAQIDAADTRVADSRQKAERRQAALHAKLSALEGQSARDAALVEQAESGLELFKRQYQMGRRRLMELVSNYESYAALKRAEVALQYDIALIKLDLAREHGILVGGSRI